jgi:bifunctional non-homologous end joining protein LigD
VVDDLPTLAWAANLGNIEFHVPLWHAGRQRTLPARPDFMVFDLDPGEGTTIVECCVVSGYVSKALAGLGMAAYAKTSGSKGLQLYTVAKARTSWDRQREQAYDIARQLESEHRDLVVSNMRKTLRKGRVLIDWSQNHPAKTTVGVYSVRAMPEPFVSTPVSASEVEACADQQDARLLRFDTAQVLRRVEQHGDLFAPLVPV